VSLKTGSVAGLYMLQAGGRVGYLSFCPAGNVTAPASCTLCSQACQSSITGQMKRRWEAVQHAGWCLLLHCCDVDTQQQCGGQHPVVTNMHQTFHSMESLYTNQSILHRRQPELPEYMTSTRMMRETDTAAAPA